MFFSWAWRFFLGCLQGWVHRAPCLQGVIYFSVFAANERSLSVRRLRPHVVKPIFPIFIFGFGAMFIVSSHSVRAGKRTRRNCFFDHVLKKNRESEFSEADTNTNPR